jgi:hypothetical protein
VQATADQKAVDSSYRRLREKYDPEHNKDAVGADALRHVLADTLEDNILDGNAVDRARDANEALFYHILKDAVAARPDVRAYVDNTARALREVQSTTIGRLWRINGHRSARSGWEACLLRFSLQRVELFCQQQLGSSR